MEDFMEKIGDPAKIKDFKMVVFFNQLVKSVKCSHPNIATGCFRKTLNEI